MQFNNSWFNELPDFYTPQHPEPLKNARLLWHSKELAQELELDTSWFTEPDKIAVWCGEALLPGMQPLAQVYSGHQFGVWAGQLGDGRGILLGEQQLTSGRKVDWHLKGAGMTPYSRMGDGRAVLRSVIREFLASEALHHLGVASTRALTIVTSDEPVRRETTEQGAMLLRVAESHVRFGHFEHFFYRQQPDKVQQLADYVIRHHWPQWKEEPDRYQLWFNDIVDRTAKLIAHWQSIGFSHGVMNTDNMSILGLTLDFGPFGFLDDYQPGFICNHSDHQGRYAFDHQPSVGLWNLHKLAQSLSGLLSPDQLRQGLARYEPMLMRTWGQKMRAKLGLLNAEREDDSILSELLALMEKEHSDYSQTFRLLSNTEQHEKRSALRDLFVDRQAFDHWYDRYRQRLLQEGYQDEKRQQVMKAASPAVILRNYSALQAINQAEQGDITALARLHSALSQPFTDNADYHDLTQPPPEWGKHLEISCSS